MEEPGDPEYLSVTSSGECLGSIPISPAVAMGIRPEPVGRRRSQ
jgi:hypothetical protein